MKPLGKVKIKWTPEFAYAIGLIASDGSLSSDGRHIDFTSKDKDLVETFKKCLKISNNIGRKTRGKEKIKKYFRVQFGDVIFYQFLVSLGITPNKSKTIGKLKIKPQYFFDFLRGSMDGDGCIRKYFDPIYPNSERLYIMFNSASRNHLVWIKEEIKNLLGIEGYVKEGVGVYSLIYAKNNSLKLLPKIYKPNCPCLLRKRDIVKTLIDD